MAEPTFIDTHIQINELDDETDYLQLGQSKATEFFEYYMNPPAPSAWQFFPERYKIIGIEIYMDFALKSINRSTYSILDYLGDIGGFRDIIQIILGFVLSGYTAYNLDSHILYQLFDQKMTKKKPEKDTASDLNSDIKASF